MADGIVRMSRPPRRSLAEKLITSLVRFFGVISTALIFGVLALVSYSVIQRYVFNTPLRWGDELLGYLLVAMVMFGAADALRQGDHIAIDLLSARGGPRRKRFFSAVSRLAVLGFALVLGISSWESILFANAFGSYSSGFLEVATWIPQLPMLIGAILIGLMALLLLRDPSRSLRREST